MSFEQQSLPSVPEILAQDHPLQESPAVAILGNQLDKNLKDILQKAPGLERQSRSFSLAWRFLSGAPLYQRISEQAMFGPKPFERTDNPEELQKNIATIRKGLHESEETIRQNPADQLTFENAWMYVSRGNRGKTSYRIYLSPKAEEVGRIFSALDASIPDDISFQMKTFFPDCDPLEAARMDKIIIYASDESVDSLWKAVQAVCQNSPATFTGRIAPGGGVATPLEGVSVTRQTSATSGTEQTGTSIMADQISEQLTQRSTEVTYRRFKKFGKQTSTISSSDEGKTLITALRTVTEKIQWYLGDEPLSDSLQAQLTTTYSDSIYPFVVNALTKGESISRQALKELFLKEVNRQCLLLTSGQRQNLASRKSIDEACLIGGNLNSIVDYAIKLTGLALEIDEGMARGRKPSETFKELIKD